MPPHFPLPIVAQFPFAPCCPTVETVVVNPGSVQLVMEISFFMIHMFDLATIFHQMPFLTQPSLFTQAWDRHYRSALGCRPLMADLIANTPTDTHIYILYVVIM